ncbi:MAG: hypothetical protein ABI082_05825 [Dokdonella sp.]
MFRQIALFLTCFAVLPLAHAADYEVDPTFGGNFAGWNRLYEPASGTQDERTVAFASTADGGYVVALEVPGGAANGGTGKRIGLARLDHNGQYVTSGFGTNGRVFKDAFLTSVTDMTIDVQGRIIVVGATPGPGGLRDFGVVRFNANGSDDTSFSGDGGTSFGFENGGGDIDDAPTSVLADPDGRIVVAGSLYLGDSDHRFGIVRFNVNGSLDSTFGSTGSAGNQRGTTDRFRNGQDAYASRILRIAAGYYVITGTSVYSSTDTDFAARILDPSGFPWTGFVGSGSFQIDEPGPGGSLYDGVNNAILVDPTTILLVGNASGKFAATRIKVGTTAGSTEYTTLTRDPSFVGSSIPGRAFRYVGTTLNSDCESAALRSDGRMVLVGGTSSTSVTGLALDSADQPSGNSLAYIGLVTRLNSDGSPDSGFGLDGSHTYVAPTTGNSPSNYTGFKQVRFDGAQPVIIGSSVDNTTIVSDFDGVITRLNADLIFADGFQTQP